MSIRQMRDHSLTIIDRVLKQPVPVLGSIERNTEIKLVLFTLCALGWDPIDDIAFAFQISTKNLHGTAKAAHAADFALRDNIGLCAIGEAKHWGVKGLSWARGLNQVRRYQDALKTPLAFITCGNRWCVFGESSLLVDDFSIDELPTPKAIPLVNRLARFLAKGACLKGQVMDPDIWRYGLSPPIITRLKKISRKDSGAGFDSPEGISF
jgi:hypothetical protein